MAKQIGLHHGKQSVRIRVQAIRRLDPNSDALLAMVKANLFGHRPYSTWAYDINKLASGPKSLDVLTAPTPVHLLAMESLRADDVAGEGTDVESMVSDDAPDEGSSVYLRSSCRAIISRACPPFVEALSPVFARGLRKRFLLARPSPA
eukprot:jgi/Chlat1/9231/Chrsp99S09291